MNEKDKDHTKESTRVEVLTAHHLNCFDRGQISPLCAWKTTVIILMKWWWMDEKKYGNDEVGDCTRKRLNERDEIWDWEATCPVEPELGIEEDTMLIDHLQVQGRTGALLQNGRKHSIN